MAEQTASKSRRISKRKKAHPVLLDSTTEQADVDRIIDERQAPLLSAMKKRKPRESSSISRLQYLCTWMDGAEPQWIDASELEGSAALEDWTWREDAQPEQFDDEVVVTQKCDQLIEWLQTAKRAVFLLGAGISAPVLPTFRGEAGLWTKDAHKNTKANASASHVQPTLAHRALTALEKYGHVYWVATQNYDDLMGRNGFPNEKLSQLHGNIFIETCTSCAKSYQRDFEVPLDGSLNHETGRSCDECGGALKDTIVHFDEHLPWHELKMANAKFVGADLTIVLGSSLRVEPAASLPFKSKRRQTKNSAEVSQKRAVIVNLQSTRMDGEADLIIRATCDTAMNHIARTLIGPSWDDTAASPPFPVSRTD